MKQQDCDGILLCSKDDLYSENKYSDFLFEDIGLCSLVRNGKCKIKHLFIYRTQIKITTKKVVDFSNSLLHFQEKDENSILIRITTKNNSIELQSSSKKLLTVLKLYTIQLNFDEQYFITKHIENGTNSKVDLAVNIKSQQLFVAKQYSKSRLSKDYQELTQVKTEIEILRNISHNHIVKFFEVFETKSQIILVLENLNGGNLITLLNRRKLSELESFIIIKQISLALHHLHKKSIYHRDLKPYNILFRNDSQLDSAVIIDFGQSNYYFEKEDKSFYTKCGTLGFVAPEIINNKRYNLKIDVYSLGIILYILLYNSEPFFGLNYNEVLHKNKHGQLKLIQSKYSPNCNDFLLQTTNVNVAQRLSIFEAISHPFITQGPGNRISNYLNSYFCYNKNDSPLQHTPRLSSQKLTQQRSNTEQRDNSQEKSHQVVMSEIKQNTYDRIKKDPINNQKTIRRMSPLNPKLVPIHVFKKINDSELLKQLYYQL